MLTLGVQYILQVVCEKSYIITSEFPKFQATDWSGIIKLSFLGSEKKKIGLVSSQSKSP